MAKSRAAGWVALIGSCALLLQPQNASAAPSFTVLYAFCAGGGSCADGGYPNGSLILDKAGNLYGTTQIGGASRGTVFKLSATGDEIVLSEFPRQNDGDEPLAGVIADSAGNLYGTTGNQATVFKISKRGKEVFHRSFTDDSEPEAGLIMDSYGFLYGTSYTGGADHLGTVFTVQYGRIHVLHAFVGGSDGAYPRANLISDSLGNFFGTTFGDSDDNGTIFEIDAKGKETILYNFQGHTDGRWPAGGLLADGQGNFYGTTEYGGQLNCDCGTVYKLSADGSHSVIHTFVGGTDGNSPAGTLVADGKGNLYGTTGFGGGSSNCYDGCGTIFEISADGKEHILYSFTGGNDGVRINGGLLLDKKGNLYGTANLGGEYNYGTVFKLMN